MNKEYFNINDLEPFFKNCFDVSVPKNIKPILLTIKDLILLEERLEEYKKYEKIFQEGWFKRVTNSGSKGEKHHVSKKEYVNLPKVAQAKVDEYYQEYQKLKMANQKISALVGEYDLDDAKIIELRRINRYTKNNPTIIWLANELGKENQFRGLTSDMLRALPTGIFQLGQEDSSTKGYFTHTSTSIKRRVRLRFGLWDQYNMELHRDDKRKESLQKFFAGFEKFEESTKEQIDSLFFYVDEYIGTEIDILLRNGQRIFKQNGFGKRYIKYHFFNEILEEVNLKTGQNKG